MDLPDQITLDEYEALPPTTQIYYKKSDEIANLDLGLNGVLQRGGYTATQAKLSKQVNDLSSVLNKFKEFADSPEILAEKIQELESLKLGQINGDENFKKAVDEIKVASEKRLNDELLKQGTSLKGVIAELEEKNKLYSQQIQEIQLWEKISELAPDLKQKFYQTFKDSFLKLFALDDDGKLKLAGTDPESLINTPSKKMESLRKEYPELFSSVVGGNEFSPYNKTSKSKTDSAKNDYYEAIKNRDVSAMLAAQRRMQ